MYILIKIKILKKKHSKMTRRKVTRRKTSHKTSTRRRHRFGMDSPFSKVTPGNGYPTPIDQYPGVISKSAQGPGINRDFFGAQVPAIVPPEYNFMYQPDGSMIPVGYPLQKSSTAYGRRRRVRRY